MSFTGRDRKQYLLRSLPVLAAPELVWIAVEAAAEADVAIVCSGLCNSHEGGTNDRTEIDLPGRQVELIEAVAAANLNTVVVLAGGTPLAVLVGQA